MTDVYIYGDSFADPHWSMSHNCKFVWPEQLAKHYRTYNHALKGTGPEYSLHKLLESNFMIKRRKQPAVCIFVISDPNRLHLEDFWQHDHEQVHILDVAAKRIPHPGYAFVRQLYEHYLLDHTHELRAACAAAAVNSLTGAFDRTLIWTIAPMQTPLRLDASVTFVNHGLLDLSEAEYTQRHNDQPYVDNRPNHFSEPNHHVMFNSIVNWIEHNTAPNVDHFVAGLL